MPGVPGVAPAGGVAEDGIIASVQASFRAKRCGGVGDGRGGGLVRVGEKGRSGGGVWVGAGAANVCARDRRRRPAGAGGCERAGGVAEGRGGVAVGGCPSPGVGRGCVGVVTRVFLRMRGDDERAGSGVRRGGASRVGSGGVGGSAGASARIDPMWSVFEGAPSSCWAG